MFSLQLSAKDFLKAFSSLLFIYFVSWDFLGVI
jgi:hypothetical protein